MNPNSHFALFIILKNINLISLSYITREYQEKIDFIYVKL